jgi:formate hydrogenlyase subunit 6/NADH:ubiquinone oxidoreductase subunit I
MMFFRKKKDKTKDFMPKIITRFKNKEFAQPNDKPLPELFENRENCCGCTACYASCPTNAITMEPDEEGFLFPVVDASKCIRCYRCLKVCAFKEAQKRKGYL